MNFIEKLQYTPFLSVISPPSQPSLWEQLRTWWKNKPSEPQESEPETDPATYSPCDPENQLRAYRKVLEEAVSVFVFRNGTAVFSNVPMSEKEGKWILKEKGKIKVGNSSGDFHVAIVDSRLQGESTLEGFVVKYSHPQIVSFADSKQYPLDCPLPLARSMIRLSREMDSYDLHVVARYGQSLES